MGFAKERSEEDRQAHLGVAPQQQGEQHRAVVAVLHPLDASHDARDMQDDHEGPKERLIPQVRRNPIIPELEGLKLHCHDVSFCAFPLHVLDHDGEEDHAQQARGEHVELLRNEEQRVYRPARGEK